MEVKNRFLVKAFFVKEQPQMITKMVEEHHC